MDNPLDKPRTPENTKQDTEDLARDLAYGALSGDWEPLIHTTSRNKWGFGWVGSSAMRSPNQEKFVEKWVSPNGKKPTYSLLTSLGFLTITYSLTQPPVVALDSVADFLITDKSYDLLDKPSSPKSIFISYRRKESSAFALLIEARLRNAGADPERIFIDKTMAGGTLWKQRIREEIKRCDYFVCLIGPSTLDSDGWVIKEIEWVREDNPNCIIIPYCHNGKRLSDSDVRLGLENGMAARLASLKIRKALSTMRRRRRLFSMG